MLLNVTQIKQIAAKDKRTGEPIMNPAITDKDVPLMIEREFEEAFNVDRMKSVRKFHPSKTGLHAAYTEKEIEICVVYLSLEGRREKSVELHIVYDYKELLKDINDLKQGKDVKGSAKPGLHPK